MESFDKFGRQKTNLHQGNTENFIEDIVNQTSPVKDKILINFKYKTIFT